MARILDDKDYREIFFEVASQIEEVDYELLRSIALL